MKKKLKKTILIGILLTTLSVAVFSQEYLSTGVTRVIQAEDVNFHQAEIETINQGYTGSAYINFANEPGGYIEWTVNVLTATTADCVFVFANGSTTRPAEIRVNDTVVISSFGFPGTGGWTTWITRGMTLELQTGENVIRMTGTGSEGGPNIDRMDITIIGDISQGKTGDVNGDNNINIIDALMTAQHYVGLNPTPFYIAASDVNCDTSTNIVDALIIARYYVGLISQFPCILTPAPTPAPTPTTSGGNITIWMAGDSTMANGGSSCPTGWGKVFNTVFDSRVTVLNRARGGRSLNNWLFNALSTSNSAGECDIATDENGSPTVTAQWQEMLDGMKAGDYLIISFGINDGTSACPRHTGEATFMTDLGIMSQAAQSRGVNPIFLTPVSAIACSGNSARGTRGEYVDFTISAGRMYNVPVIDLHQLSVDLYNARGFCPLPGGAGDVSASTGGAVGSFFCDDHTHFDAEGALAIAELVGGAIRSRSLGLSSYLR